MKEANLPWSQVYATYKSGTIPVYRYYNNFDHDHVYTSDYKKWCRPSPRKVDIRLPGKGNSKSHDFTCVQL